MKMLMVLAAVAAVLIASPKADALISVHYDRAGWEAQVSGLVTEDLNSLVADLTLTMGGASWIGPTGMQITNVQSPNDGNKDSQLTTNGAHARNIDGTSFLTWSGTTGSEPWTRIDLPVANAYGVGVDYNVQSPSNDSDGRPHNSFYFNTVGNSGQVDGGGTFGFGTLVNDSDDARPLQGFFGVIDDQGGIGFMEVGSIWTNWQGFGVDNFVYATTLGGGGGGGTEGGLPIPEAGPLGLVSFGILALRWRRR
jgi:hypothetical protein